MVTITDVTPTVSSMSFGSTSQFTTGRMLSVDSSDDGNTVFAGAFSSNLWRSVDGGQSWTQLTWDQPAEGQYSVPGAIGGYCVPSIAVGPDLSRWTISTPRALADLTGDGRADIVGFGETGVWTSLSRGDGTFEQARVVLAGFGVQAGDWQVDKHMRVLADLTGDGRADIVGFGDAGVWVALSHGDGTFDAPAFVIEDFGYQQGWRVGEHPRLLADVTGNGRADVVGFGNAGVYLALSNGDGTFTYTPTPVVDNFGLQAGDWTVDRHVRVLADLTGNGRADIVGFGDAGVWVALSNGDGTFAPASFVLEDFGYQQGWRTDQHPRFLADLTGNGRADIVGFGNAGVYMALSNGDGTFGPVQFVLGDLGYEQGWRTDEHVRAVADVTGNGHADLVGFGDAGVYVATGNGDGTFAPASLVLADFGYQQGWRVDQHPRFLSDLTGTGRFDAVGFGDAGVYTSSLDVASAAPLARFVLANFGAGLVVLAMVQCDRADQDAGVWRSADGGDSWAPVHAFPRAPGSADLPGAGQLVWVPGTAHLVFAAGGSSLAVSTDAGVTFTDLMPLGGGAFQPVTHVAASGVAAGSLIPQAVYALASGAVFVSFDAGQTWTADTGSVPSTIGGGTGTYNSQNDRVLVVSPRSALEVFATGNANLVPPQLWRGDYSAFASSQASQWTALPLPALGQQYSGNVFLAATRLGQGEAIFYGPQRSQIFVASPDPQSANDWHALDSSHTHVDLHGIFLAPGFTATAAGGGSYSYAAGTLWVAADGGLYRSTDGGDTIAVASSASTLSTVNIAGVTLFDSGPVIAMGTGDNDGFVTTDGGLHWQPQDYGGGDDDCAWSDPLRSNMMLVFTPRWDQNAAPVAASAGQTITLYEAGAGQLADPSDGGARHVVPGPPLLAGSVVWNASSGYGIGGYRPLVLDLPSTATSDAVDFLAIRFYGNVGSLHLPNNLAVLMRAPDLHAITRRSDWNTPGGWQVDKHPRLLGDLTGNGRADIVGFGDAGVWTALATSGGSFDSPRFVLADLGYDQGWRVDQHPRVLADVNGDGRLDIVGFGNAGVYVALADGSGGYTYTPTPVVPDFGAQAGDWQVDKHVRVLADITGDGSADIVGFGDAGVYVALSNGDGTFGPVRQVIDDFGYDQGWRVDQHPRFLADLTGNGRADIVGFGNAGVYVALSKGDGTFTYSPVPAINDFGYQQGWRVDLHPRLLADVTGNGRADIVGFGNAGVYVALSKGDGTFTYSPTPVLDNFGVDAGSWQVDRHVRVLADVTGNGRADIVGFGDAGVWVALSQGDGSFAAAAEVIADFGYDQGWRVDEHPRFAADLTGNGLADLVGFGDAGVLVDVHGPDGSFGTRALFVIPGFGFQDSGPVQQVGPFLPDPNIGVVQASGGHDATVFYVSGGTPNGLWRWTSGQADWQRLVPAPGVNAAHRFFVSPYDPNDVYVLDDDHVQHSVDGGTSWQVDSSLEQHVSDGGRIAISRNQDADGQGDHYDVVLSDIQFDPDNPQRRFAVGLAGVFMTTDAVTWTRLLDTEALRGRPTNCFFDQTTDPGDPALYVGFAGRGIVKIDGFDVAVIEVAREPAAGGGAGGAPSGGPPVLVRTSDGRVGTLSPMPDERARVAFPDGSSVVVDADRLRRQDDGTYAVG